MPLISFVISNRGIHGIGTKKTNSFIESVPPFRRREIGLEKEKALTPRLDSLSVYITGLWIRSHNGLSHMCMYRYRISVTSSNRRADFLTSEARGLWAPIGFKSPFESGFKRKSQRIIESSDPEKRSFLKPPI